MSDEILEKIEEYLDGKFVQGDTVALEMNENHIKFVRK